MARQYRKVARRGFSRARRGASRANKLLGLDPAFVVGALVGYSNMDEKIPENVTLAAAVNPMKFKGAYQAKQAACGIIAGNKIQQFMNGRDAGTGANSDFGV